MELNSYEEFLTNGLKARGYTVEMLKAYDDVAEAEETFFNELEEAGISKNKTEKIEDAFVNCRNIQKKKLKMYVKNFVKKAIDEAFKGFAR